MRPPNRCNHRPSITSFWLLTALALCAGCSSTEKFDIPGAEEAFCVPHSKVVNAPSWVDDTMAAYSGGFAFLGCSDSDKEICPFPSSMSTGTVGPLSRFFGWSWMNFPEDAHYRTVTQQAIENHTYRVYPDTGPTSRILAVPLDGYRTATLFWRVSAEGSPRMTENAELLASCKGTSPGKQAGDEVGYQCSRSARLDKVAVSYQFQNGVITTQLINGLDRGVETGLKRWHCH